MAKFGEFVQNNKTAKLTYDETNNFVLFRSEDTNGYNFLFTLKEDERLMLKRSTGNLTLLVIQLEQKKGCYEGLAKIVKT